MFRRTLWPAAIFLVSLTAALPAQTFKIDPGHSSVSFSIRHFVSKVKGRFTDFSGTINYDSTKIENSSVNVIIQTASINTDNEKRDGHLKSPDFFEVEKYPEITFQSKKVENKEGKYILAGTFKMHGVEKEISFPFEILGLSVSPEGTARAGFEAEFAIDRKDYGITYNRALDQGGFLLGDEVKVSIAIEAIYRKPETK